MSLRCIAIDDEPFAIGIIADYCSRIPFINLVQTFHSGIDALNFLKNNKVDLVFLDIQMRDITGIQLLEIVQPIPKVILTTAYEEYALKSYEYGITDYLLKPYSFERFLKAVSKAMEQIIPVTANHEYSQSENRNDYIFVKSGYSIVKVNYEDITYLEGKKDYLLLHTEKEKIQTLQSLKQFEDLLPESDFIRVHRSFIVAMKKIIRVERLLIKIGDTEIPIGDSYKEYFFQTLRSKMMG